MTTRRVIARKSHRCDVCGQAQTIEPGHVYLRHVSFPGDVNSTNVPWVIKECLDCAHTHGRSDACYPIPDNQPDRYWLGDLMPPLPDPLETR